MVTRLFNSFDASKLFAFVESAAQARNNPESLDALVFILQSISYRPGQEWRAEQDVDRWDRLLARYPTLTVGVQHMVHPDYGEYVPIWPESVPWPEQVDLERILTPLRAARANLLFDRIANTRRSATQSPWKFHVLIVAKDHLVARILTAQWDVLLGRLRRLLNPFPQITLPKLHFSAPDDWLAILASLWGDDAE